MDDSQLRTKSVLSQYLCVLKQLGQKDVFLSAETAQKLEAMPESRGERVSGKEIKPQRVGSSLNRQWMEKEKGGAEREEKTGPVSTFDGEKILDPAERAEVLKQLAQEIQTAPQCKALFKNYKNMVFGVGTLAPKIMFVGEAPGADEDEQGEPFVGKAGQLLTKMIKAMGLERKDVYIGNIVKYRPDMPPGSWGNRKPTLEEVNACRPFTFRQIGILRPQVIIALGATSMEGLLELPKVAITRVRGNWHDFRGIPVMPTFHPAYLLRNQGIREKRKAWEDLLAVMEKANMPITEKQKNYFLKAM